MKRQVPAVNRVFIANSISTVVVAAEKKRRREKEKERKREEENVPINRFQKYRAMNDDGPFNSLLNFPPLFVVSALFPACALSLSLSLSLSLCLSMSTLPSSFPGKIKSRDAARADSWAFRVR